MNYAIRTTVEPTGEPVSLEDAKKHLRVPTNNEDGNIERIYIPTARRQIETEIGRSLLTTTWQLSLDRFPRGSQPIMIPRNPLIAVTSITYIDTTGTQQTLDSSKYVVDTQSEPGRINPTWNNPWPSVRKRTAESTVSVTFTAGYGTKASDVPAGLREAMLLLIGHFYYHREDVIIGTNAMPLPRAVDSLLSAYSYGDEFISYGA